MCQRCSFTSKKFSRKYASVKIKTFNAFPNTAAIKRKRKTFTQLHDVLTLMVLLGFQVDWNNWNTSAVGVNDVWLNNRAWKQPVVLFRKLTLWNHTELSELSSKNIPHLSSFMSFIKHTLSFLYEFDSGFHRGRCEPVDQLIYTSNI